MEKKHMMRWESVIKKGKCEKSTRQTCNFYSIFLTVEKYKDMMMTLLTTTSRWYCLEDK